MACVADREAAVREVAQVYELIKLQQPLLLLHSPQKSPSPTTQLAQSLLGKALRALNVALSVMKQQPPAAPAPVTPISSVVVKAEPHLSPTPPPPSPASADSQAASLAPARRGVKRRRSSVATEVKKSSWTTETAVPYDDGYEWRKYGEKKINGTLFTRSYFRCTYKDDAGCLATKHVQQMDNSSNDSPMFHVTYNNDHTCNNRAKANTGSSSNNLAALLTGCCNGNGSGKGLKTTTDARQTGHTAAATAMTMKQEEPAALMLPALINLQPSACFPYGQISQCQQEPLFATSMEQQFVCGPLRDHGSPVDGDIPSATGSCISGETSWWDGYSGDVAAQMAAEDDDPLHDLDRFLQCDSFIWTTNS